MNSKNQATNLKTLPGPWSLGEMTGNWRDIDLPDHGGVMRIVWKMEDDEGRNDALEAQAHAVVAALNAAFSKPPAEQQAASSAVLKAIREAKMQLVRTGDDAFMLVPYKVATTGAALGAEQVAPKTAPGAPIAWTPGPNLFKDWCAQWFGPDSDDDYLAKAVFNLPPMAQVFKEAAPQQEAQEPVALLVRKNSWRAGQWEVAPPGSPSYGLGWADQRKYVYAAPQPTPAPLSRDQIREVFMAHGFTIKEGQADLKQYVYDAAHALLELVAAPQQEAQPNYVVSLVVIKETPTGFNTQNKLYAVHAGSAEDAIGKAVAQLPTDFPEHRLHTSCFVQVSNKAPQQEAQEPVGEVQHLHELNDSWLNKLPVGTKLYTTHQPAPAPLSDDAKDAARYRWLRDFHHGDVQDDLPYIAAGEGYEPSAIEVWNNRTPGCGDVLKLCPAMPTDAELLAHIKEAVPGLTRVNTALMVAKAVLEKFGSMRVAGEVK